MAGDKIHLAEVGAKVEAVVLALEAIVSAQSVGIKYLMNEAFPALKSNVPNADHI